MYLCIDTVNLFCIIPVILLCNINVYTGCVGVHTVYTVGTVLENRNYVVKKVLIVLPGAGNTIIRVSIGRGESF